MKPVVARIGAGLLAAVVLVAGTAAGKDGGPEAGAASDGGKSCTDSNDCTQPAAHCHPARHECVECLSNRNCGGGLVCDVAAGVCAACSSDADCPMQAPYCTSGACVQCRTDANCGNEGVVCSGGVCGSCGDGVCHRSEFIADGFGGGCPEDCASLCPTVTLALNETRTISATRDLFPDCLGGGARENDFTVAFTAPKEALYELKLKSDAPGGQVSFTQMTECGGAIMGCYGSNGSALFSFTAGESALFAIESPTARDFELQMVEYEPVCFEGDCGPVEPDGGQPTEAQTAECLADAGKRGDPICAGVTCACTECPRAYDACGEAEGCTDVVQCMHDKSCIGVDCYTSGACRRLVDVQGGVSGPAFRTATALQACTLSHLCALPCSDEQADAGEASPPDAGPLCVPGRRVACACEGGASGTRRCNESGTTFAECVCAPPEVPEPASCDCSVGRRASPGGVALLLFGLTAGLAGLRRGHASRRYR